MTQCNTTQHNVDTIQHNATQVKSHHKKTSQYYTQQKNTKTFEKNLADTIYIVIFAKKDNNMALVILENKEATSKLKATVQKSGKLGFTDTTAKYLRLANTEAIQFAADDQEEDTLYLINGKHESDENTFKVCKAGKYFYINAKHLFDELGLDYETYTIIFDLKRESKYGDIEVYKMKKRILPRK